MPQCFTAAVWSLDNTHASVGRAELAPPGRSIVFRTITADLPGSSITGLTGGVIPSAACIHPPRLLPLPLKGEQLGGGGAIKLHLNRWVLPPHTMDSVTKPETLHNIPKQEWSWPCHMDQKNLWIHQVRGGQLCAPTTVVEVQVPSCHCLWHDGICLSSHHASESQACNSQSSNASWDM